MQRHQNATKLTSVFKAGPLWTLPTDQTDPIRPPWPMWMQIASRMASSRKAWKTRGKCPNPPCDVAASITTPVSPKGMACATGQGPVPQRSPKVRHVLCILKTGLRLQTCNMSFMKDSEIIPQKYSQVQNAYQATTTWSLTAICGHVWLWSTRLPSKHERNSSEEWTQA